MQKYAFSGWSVKTQVSRKQFRMRVIRNTLVSQWSERCLVGMQCLFLGKEDPRSKQWHWGPRDRRTHMGGGRPISKDSDENLPRSIHTNGRRWRWDTEHPSQLCTAQRSKQHQFTGLYQVKNLKTWGSSLPCRQKCQDIHGVSWLYEYPGARSVGASQVNDPEQLKTIRSMSVCSEAQGVWQQGRLYC